MKTLRGLRWKIYGDIMWFITNGHGCIWYLLYSDINVYGNIPDWRGKVGKWLVEQYGYSYNPEWS